jgi:hypothetical protein
VINNNFTVTGVQGSVQFWYPGNVKFGGSRWGPNLVFNNVINDTDAGRIRLDRLNWYDVGKVSVANPMCGNVVHGPYYGGNFWLAYTGSDNDQDLLGDTSVPHMGYDNHPLIRALCGDVNLDDVVNSAGDATLIKAWEHGYAQILCYWAADVTGEGIVDSTGDAMRISAWEHGYASLNCRECGC